MKPILRYMPHDFSIDFVGMRAGAFILAAFLVIASVTTIGVKGFNFGIDFAGGVLIEARSEQQVGLANLRGQLNALAIGDVQITTFGDTGRDVMIRVPQQEGGDAAQGIALKKVQSVLRGDYEIRRTEVVGPKVGGELIISGALAVALAVLAIAVYVWFRFEWQFALGACLALCHDVLTTLGLFSFFELDFDLTTVAAILAVAGYSINDSVVVYDRVRETLRKYRKMPLPELFNIAMNRVFPRTLLTTFTTLLAVLALLVLGGPALRGFSIAMLWGLFVGTYSSIWVGLPVLLYFDVRGEETGGVGPDGDDHESEEAPA